MKIQSGDNVKFLNEVGGGTVTRIEGDNAWVLLNNGMEICVTTGELILNMPLKSEKDTPDKAISRTTSKGREEGIINAHTGKLKEKRAPARPQKQITEKVELVDGKCYIALVLADDHSVDIYLINKTTFFLLYNTGIFENSDHALLDAGILEPGLKLILCNIPSASFNSFKGISCQLIKYKKGIYNPENVINSILKIKPVKLIGRSNFHDNEYFEKPAWFFPVDNEKPADNVDLQKNEKSSLTIRKSSVTPGNKNAGLFAETREVDLHIGKLADDVKGMSNSEMLAVQLSKFRTELEKAIKDNVRRIIFIHGVGNGTLKLSLRKQLVEYYSDFSFQDASYEEYGFGATMVILNKP